MPSFYIRKLKNGKYTVMEQSYLKGKSIQKTLNELARLTLGFPKEMPMEKAQKRCKYLNKYNSNERKNNHTMVGAAKNKENIDLCASIFVPKEIIDEFEIYLDKQSFGSPAHRKRLYSHFLYVTEMINKLEIEAHKYAQDKEKIYEYFIQRNNSIDYVNKILRILNMFGLFICRSRLIPFEPVPKPNSHIRNKIEEIYQESENFIGESNPLSPQELETVKNKFPNINQYKWLFISIWFGLRPKEIDNLKILTTWKITSNTTHNIDVLWVYQSKLTRLTKEKRWKKIPIIFKEQIKALEFIKEQDFKRPIANTLKTLFMNKHITTYAGRKGFVSLMLEKEQKLEHISQWLGHQSIEITWKKYRDKEEVMFTKKIV